MSVTLPIATAGVAVGSLLAVFWSSPFEPTLDGMSARLDSIQRSINRASAGNELTAALKTQVTRLISHYDDQRDAILVTRDVEQLVRVVRNASILKTLHENLLASPDLHEIVHKSPMRVTEGGEPDPVGNPVGVMGRIGVRVWVLGGMRADLEGATGSSDGSTIT